MGEGDHRDAGERQHQEPSADDWHLLLCKSWSGFHFLPHHSTRAFCSGNNFLTTKVLVKCDSHIFPLALCRCALSLSLRYVTQTWSEMGCTHSQAFRGLATRVSIRLSGTLPSSATTRGEETISNSPTLTKNTHDTCYLYQWKLEFITRVFYHGDNANMWVTLIYLTCCRQYKCMCVLVRPFVCARVCVFMVWQCTSLQVKSLLNSVLRWGFLHVTAHCLWLRHGVVLSH